MAKVLEVSGEKHGELTRSKGLPTACGAGDYWPVVGVPSREECGEPPERSEALARGFSLVGDEQGRGTTLLRGWADCISVGNR